VKITAGVFASFEDMCWTIPSERAGEIARKAQWGTPTESEVKILASMVGCYWHLIMMPEKLRRTRIRQLREALKLAASQVSEP
jgi:hypothetical protein